MSEGFYIHLFHGRKHPNQDMEDWGYDGPTIGPFASIHITYLNHWRLQPVGSDEWYDVFFDEDTLHYEDDWYGDWSINVEPPATPIPFEPARFHIYHPR